MKTYTLHVPRDSVRGDPLALEKAELVPDRFSWGAFLFTFLWFFWNRLWLAGLLVLAAVGAVAVGLPALKVSPGAVFLAEFLLALLIGMEANSLRRWTWRKKKPAVDVVAAGDIDEAEAKAFARWLAPGETAAPAPVVRAALAPATLYRPAEPVIGLFPDAERAR
jgi:hypothetical protein